MARFPIEWVEMALGMDHSMGSKAMKAARFLRIVRFIRIIRILRISKSQRRGSNSGTVPSEPQKSFSYYILLHVQLESCPQIQRISGYEC